MLNIPVSPHQPGSNRKPVFVRLRSLLVIGLSCFFASALAQQQETVYRTKGDTLQNYYLALKPDSAIKGLLVILPGFGTTPAEVLTETRLPEMAARRGFTVIIPLLVDYEKEDTFNVFQSRLETLIPEVQKKYVPTGVPFIIGGHSLGGLQALYYAEQAFKKNDPKIIKPRLVFGVDPPLDLKRLYDNYERFLKNNPAKARGSEAEFIVNRFRHIYGGSPLQKPRNYELASAFYRNAKDGGNARFLRSVPVRLYADPDINWYITERDTPVERTNLADITACIVQLRLLGNKKAEFVSCLGKGYQNGKRHPHGFSMLDPEDFLEWVEREK